jgi:hypothetical protein
VSHIFSLLERVTVKPIILEWHDKEIQTDVPLEIKPSSAKLPTRQISTRNRKLPTIRNDDFYGTFKCESI